MTPGGEDIARVKDVEMEASDTSRVKNILIVDDEADVRRLITLILEKKGYVVAQAADGRMALQRLDEMPFDLVITDLQMPEMGGLPLLEECRAFYPETDVIVLTAHGSIQSAVHAMKHGADDFLTKPFELDDLERKVASCFERRRARNETRAKSMIGPLVELGRILSDQTSLPETLDNIVDLVQHTFEPLSIEVRILGTEPQNDIIVAQAGKRPEDLGYPCLSRQQMQHLMQQAEPWLLRDSEPSGSVEPAGEGGNHARYTGYRAPSGLGITVPLLSGDDATGALTLVRSPSSARFTHGDAQLLQIFGFQIGISISQARTRQRLLDTFHDLKRANLTTVQALFAAIETYDRYTHDHSERVSRFAYILGKCVQLPEDQLEILRVAGLLHDIGKLGIGDDTLHKNGSLTSDEFDKVKLHPVMGARILGGIEAFADAVPMVLYHHERYDGQGYPNHLAHTDIPIGARIIAVVDTFDSMTSNRPYRPALTVPEALTRLQEEADTQLDGRLTREWCELVRQERINGEEVRVATPHDISDQAVVQAQ
jgi:response regulator RpfG family c-di-GMP phosphodiesterase